jgi:polyphosphate kinase 2 (PPK2 family)
MDGLPTSIAGMEQHTPDDQRLVPDAYEPELRILQIGLLELQAGVRAEGRRMVILSVSSNEKRRARLESIRAVLHALDDDHEDDAVAHRPDPLVVLRAGELEIPADEGTLAETRRPAT